MGNVDKYKPRRGTAGLGKARHGKGFKLGAIEHEKSKPEVSRILGPTLKNMIASIFDLNRLRLTNDTRRMPRYRLEQKSWLRDAMTEKPQKPKYTYPLKRDSKGRMMKPEMAR